MVYLPRSTGTVTAMVSRCTAKVKPALKMIKDHMINAYVAHFDGIGSHVDGKMCWVHVASDSEYTCLFYSNKRGHKGMDEMGVLPIFQKPLG